MLNEGQVDELIATITTLVTSESTTQPSWINAISSTTLRDMSSADDDIKFILRHIALPYALTAYNKLREGSSAPLPQTTSTSSSDSLAASMLHTVEGNGSNGNGNSISGGGKTGVLFASSPLATSDAAAVSALDEYMTKLGSHQKGWVIYTCTRRSYTVFVFVRIPYSLYVTSVIILTLR